jgi:imidazolonepropionase-like amidohydrolase
MSKRFAGALLIACALFPVVHHSNLSAQEQAIVIRGARVFDGLGTPVRVATVIIRGSKIEAIGPDLAAPAGARVIDATGKTLLPGLIDLHTHLNSSGAPGAGISADTGKILKAYLARGITTVVEMSSYTEMFAPLRTLLDNGSLPGPHVVFASRFSTPGGHGAESGMGETITTEVNTPRAVHLAMRRILPYKPDAIKAFTDGWRYGSIPNLSSMNFETVAAIVQDAHAAGIIVVSHTVTLAGAKIAARAGVDVIDHGVGDLPADDELISLLKEHGNHYGFTLTTYEPKNLADPPPALTQILEPATLSLAKRAPAAAIPDAPSSESRRQRYAVFVANAATLHKAGIPIGDGTDAGMAQSYHGWATLHEIEILVNQCGYTPSEALIAATRVSAEGLRRGSTVGTIVPGKTADLLLVHGNPDQDIKAIENTSLTFLAGKPFDPKALEAAIRLPDLTPLPVHKISALVDDVERADGRTNLDTLPIEPLDAGADHSRVVVTRVLRDGKDHALLAAAQFGSAEHPLVKLEFPVTRGAVELGDVSSFSGVSFDVRGEGQYRLLLKTYGVRDSNWYAAPIAPSRGWSSVHIPFVALKRAGTSSSKWSARDLQALIFEISGAPESTSSLELDNVTFYSGR